jgi:Pentapeptide repeats (8 copies)
MMAARKNMRDESRKVEQEQQPHKRAFIREIRELVSDWRLTSEHHPWMTRVTIVLVALAILTLIGLPFEITLWDWLNLLAVPITVGGAVPLLTKLQKDRELDVQKRQAQDEALQTYLGEIGHLLLEKGLRDSHEHGKGAYTDRSHSPEDENVRTLARARTLTVVRTLDRDQKRSVLDFLYESKLITPPEPLSEPEERPWWRRMIREQSQRIVPTSPVEPNKPSPIVDLGGIDSFGGAADLSDANLEADHLALADLHGANLTAANLSKANLRESDLHECDLREADLREADLSGANLSAADLSKAELSRAILDIASSETRGLIKPSLANADLTSADLSGVDLTSADLSGAIGVTKEQLEQHVSSLDGATMPNGQKYEAWRKNKKAVINCKSLNGWPTPPVVINLKDKEGQQRIRRTATLPNCS